MKEVLLIEDDPATRESVREILERWLPEDCAVVAPDTLREAVGILALGLVRVALIDYALNSNGFQPLGDDGIEYENVSGSDVAQEITRDFPGVTRVAFSKGRGPWMRDHVDKVFSGKISLGDDSPEGMKARDEFKTLILGLIE
ncbi:MAG: hypothetical protein O3B47_00050 [bacterium]|nr:hypothetical protein [bacterium]